MKTRPKSSQEFKENNFIFIIGWNITEIMSSNISYIHLNIPKLVRLFHFYNKNVTFFSDEAELCPGFNFS